MINVSIVRSGEQGRIVSFAIKGHAKYAKPGKDIVCAGVSAVTVGTVNAIETLAGIQLPAQMQNGWLSSEIPEIPDAELDGKVQLLLESMLVMLDTIVQSYGKYIAIREEKL